jgi:hypothetical protein
MKKSKIEMTETATKLNNPSRRLLEDYDEPEGENDEHEQLQPHGEEDDDDGKPKSSYDSHKHKAIDHICSEAKVAAAFVCQVCVIFVYFP